MGVVHFWCIFLGIKKNLQGWNIIPCRFSFAEREGFEPPEPLSSTVFKTAAIDHSAISPSVLVKNRKKCAQDETRTHTVLRPLPPQSSVYTNFTTCASSECNLFDCLFSKITLLGCAQNRTRTCTSLNTRTWNERVYQFRHLGATLSLFLEAFTKNVLEKKQYLCTRFRLRAMFFNILRQ